MPKEASIKRDSLDWSDSDNSIELSSRRSSNLSQKDPKGGRLHRHHDLSVSRRKSKDVLKMLHQTQADLLVKKELVDQLNRTEAEYNQMRQTYEHQLRSLVELQQEQEQERELQRRLDHEERARASPLPRSASPASPDRAGSPLSPRLSKSPSPHLQQQRQYESRLKRLTSENDKLQRQITDTVSAMTTARAKAEQIVQRLRTSVQQLRSENKQLQKSMQQEQSRLRAQLAATEQELMLLKRTAQPPLVK
ncbi:hypothetical protein DM01DRAFT_1173444 [Hesseltinella vesiculosa]|uniref:Uncharacterized protein n=1 Tax=Hesseltinella vesiculosa TaxID=101127 RepID=A0A1X2G651_9FUNG|nr:hypothetical protein DM01DRAFT_1173444 [Hesseltinella vesiculosa]